MIFGLNKTIFEEIQWYFEENKGIREENHAISEENPSFLNLFALKINVYLLIQINFAKIYYNLLQQ